MDNNYIVSIPKNLKEIQSKLFFGLTKRQLIGFGIGGLLGVLIFLSLKNFSLDLAMYSLFFIVAPIIFATIYKKDGMYVEQWIKLMIEQKYLNPKKRRYKVTRQNYQLARKRGIFINEKHIQNKPKRQRVEENKPVSSPTIINKPKQREAK